VTHGARGEGPGVDVRLLGRFGAWAGNGLEIRLTGRHAQALFTLLAMTRRPRTREAIAADLWPDAAAPATGPLRQALYQVRHAIADALVDPDAVLESFHDTLGIRADAIGSLDLVAFEACLDDPVCRSEQAVAMYGGDLAEGLGHECFAAERERLADHYEDSLAAVAVQRLDAGDLDGARRMAERLLARDPLREEAHAVLIGVHGLAGSRAQVARQYRRLRDVLARELGEMPLPETDAAYRVAMARTLARSYEQATLIDRPAPGLLAVAR
jgi:DNA-binding SARP family transcriptional activator